jgi:vacuolar-type H+-ATPase subunit C/Vma6
MVSRRLGATGIRDVAGAATLDDAVKYLGATAYGHDLAPRAGLAAAQRSVAVTLLWHLRVLAGWQPRTGAAALRLLASGFEIANIDARLRALSAPEQPPGPPPYRLGALATAWPRLSAATSPDGLRARVLRRHWIPRLQDALAHAELALEQAEHEDAVRRRWAARMQG